MKTPRFPRSDHLYAVFGLLVVVALLLTACATSITPVLTPSPVSSTPVTPSPSPTPAVSPTPLPAILKLPLRRYDDASGAFSLQVPDEWQEQSVPGGVQFTADERHIRLTSLFQLLPVTTEPVVAVSDVITDTLIKAQLLDPATFVFLRDEIDPSGRRVIEFRAQLEEDEPLAHVIAGVWSESGAVIGLSLSADDAAWDEVAPLYPVILDTFTLHDLSELRRQTSLLYEHPSGAFTTTIPATWGIISEEDDAVLFGDKNGYAQYMISISSYDHRPTQAMLSAALRDALGDLPQQPEYVELANETVSDFEHMIRFETLSGDGFYRTELRAFSAGNLLFMTSFNAPPHDWDLYQPDYDMMRSNLHPLAPPPPEEEEQDADPTVGIYTEDVMFYRAGGGALWVSAPIRNNRTRNLNHITAAVQLLDADGRLIAAESWRMPQRILAAGAVTYLTQRISPDVADLDRVDSVRVAIVNARDTDKQAPPAWGYVGGDALMNERQHVILRVRMRNTASYSRRRIVAVALLYNSQGKAIFARSETITLPRPVAPGKTAELTIKVWGPLPEVASFDVIGEEAR